MANHSFFDDFYLHDSRLTKHTEWPWLWWRKLPSTRRCFYIWWYFWWLWCVSQYQWYLHWAWWHPVAKEVRHRDILQQHTGGEWAPLIKWITNSHANGRRDAGNLLFLWTSLTWLPLLLTLRRQQRIQQKGDVTSKSTDEWSLPCLVKQCYMYNKLAIQWIPPEVQAVSSQTSLAIIQDCSFLLWYAYLKMCKGI